MKNKKRTPERPPIHPTTYRGWEYSWLRRGINVNAELKKIKNYLSGLSEEELDNVLFECGIENVDFPK